MTIKEVITKIEAAAIPLVNVNSVNDGDVYEILNNKQILYGNVTATPIDTTIGGNSYIHTLYLYYTDRLLNANQNVNDIYSAAAMTLDTIITKLSMDDDISRVDTYSNAIYFNQKFADMCAGAYIQIRVTTQKPNICYQIENEKDIL